MKTAIGAPLHEAASRGDHKTIIALLADGAGLHARDDDGWTPLHFAASAALLDARADLQLPPHQWQRTASGIHHRQTRTRAYGRPHRAKLNEMPTVRIR